VSAVLEGAPENRAGNVYVGPATDGFTHDADGNLLTDGTWSNTWDGENRLTKIEAKSGVPAGAKRKGEYEYDYLGRRVAKKVWYWDSGSGSYVLGLQRRFVYDGWNVLVELDGATNSVMQRYVWGMDVSGSMQGAGGVGGFVAVKSSSGVAHFAAMDGNGNVMGLVEGSTGLASANYEYGPFGEPIRVTGTLGKANPFRWSTKFTDDETDLVYYGRRYYNPSTGRWLSRDPAGEDGGPNLYGFVGNNPVSAFDPFGLDVSWQPEGSLRRGWQWRFKADFQEATCQLVFSLNVEILRGDNTQRLRQLYGSLREQWERSFEERYSGWKLVPADSTACCKCRSGIKIKFDLTFDRGTDPTADVTIYNDYGESNAREWFFKDSRPGGRLPFTVPNYVGVSHEVGHLFGLEDEYPDPDRDPNRFIPRDYRASIMGTGRSVLQRHIEQIALVNAAVDYHIPCHSTYYEVKRGE
ncbi:MAG: RHS repeat-associated core domain-containing protein, partial [Verrucomicrobia bacterium]|nr:RHS repeat-associated core domain-containing protein [Verrucomicrobiota bacterium]